MTRRLLNCQVMLTTSNNSKLFSTLVGVLKIKFREVTVEQGPYLHTLYCLHWAHVFLLLQLFLYFHHKFFRVFTAKPSFIVEFCYWRESEK